MITFNDLIFKDNFGAINAHHTFNNDWVISVAAGRTPYSTPREDLGQPELFSSFEVAIFNSNGDFATEEIFPGNDVLGWKSRDEINSIIILVDEK